MVIILKFIPCTLQQILMSAKQIMFLSRFVCWLVCLLAGLIKILLMNFYGLFGTCMHWDKKQTDLGGSRGGSESGNFLHLFDIALSSMTSKYLLILMCIYKVVPLKSQLYQVVHCE